MNSSASYDYARAVVHERQAQVAASRAARVASTRPWTRRDERAADRGCYVRR